MQKDPNAILLKCLEEVKLWMAENLACKVQNKFCINNKMKDVSYKIFIQLSIFWKVRFKLNISYTSEFCAIEK